MKPRPSRRQSGLRVRSPVKTLSSTVSLPPWRFHVRKRAVLVGARRPPATSGVLAQSWITSALPSGSFISCGMVEMPQHRLTCGARQSTTTAPRSGLRSSPMVCGSGTTLRSCWFVTRIWCSTLSRRSRRFVRFWTNRPMRTCWIGSEIQRSVSIPPGKGPFGPFTTRQSVAGGGLRMPSRCGASCSTYQRSRCSKNQLPPPEGAV